MYGPNTYTIVLQTLSNESMKEIISIDNRQVKIEYDDEV